MLRAYLISVFLVGSVFLSAPILGKTPCHSALLKIFGKPSFKWPVASRSLRDTHFEWAVQNFDRLMASNEYLRGRTKDRLHNFLLQPQELSFLGKVAAGEIPARDAFEWEAIEREASEQKTFDYDEDIHKPRYSKHDIAKAKRMAEEIVQLDNLSIRMYRRESLEEIKRLGYLPNLASSVAKGDVSFLSQDGVNEGMGVSDYDAGHSAADMLYFSEMFLSPWIKIEDTKLQSMDHRFLEKALPKHAYLTFKKLPSGVKHYALSKVISYGAYHYEVDFDKVGKRSLAVEGDAWFAFKDIHDEYLKKRRHKFDPDCPFNKHEKDGSTSMVSRFHPLTELDLIRKKVFWELLESNFKSIQLAEEDETTTWEVLVYGRVRPDELRPIKP